MSSSVETSLERFLPAAAGLELTKGEHAQHGFREMGDTPEVVTSIAV